MRVLGVFRSRKPRGWLRSQHSYGMDAGRQVDENGNANENLRLEDLVARTPGGWAAVLVPVVAREPEVTVLLTLRNSHLTAHSGQICLPRGKDRTA